MDHTHRPSLWLVFAVVLIDMLGFGVVMPVLPELIMRLGHMPVDSAAVYAGWLGAGYAVMQFFAAPIFGSLSDRFGRRPVLLAALLGYAVDYAVMGMAPAIGWLIVGRIVAGITGASYSTAFAYIADVTPAERRAASFGLIGMAFGFGFIIGPAIGGLLATISLRLPFFFAAGLALANFALGLFLLKESLPRQLRRPFSWRQAHAFGALRTLRNQSATVLWFVAALGVWQLAHIVYPAIWAYFAIAAYGFNEKQIGLALAVVGLASALVQGVVLRLVAPRWGERAAVALGVAAFSIAAMLYVVAKSTAMVYVAIAIGGLQGLIQPSIAALNSRAVDARSQGELQGATQGIGSIAQIIGPPLYSAVFAKFSGPSAVFQLPAMPLLLAAVFAVLTLGLFLAGSRRLARDQSSPQSSDQSAAPSSG